MFAQILNYILDYLTPKEEKTSVITYFSQIEAILKTNHKKLFSFIYNNRDRIHQILYDEDQTIKLESILAEKGISNLFYLDLLIKDQECIINYIYELSFIEKVNKRRKNMKNSLACLILAMIIIDLIHNFKESDLYDEEKDKEIVDKILEENKKIKNDYKDVLKKAKLRISDENFEDNNMSKIYLEILKSIIENKNLNDYEKSCEVFEQMDLKNIELTEGMFNELLTIFKNNEEYTNEFKFLNIDDLFNPKKLNFYYAIFQYIFKQSIYIYNFNFLSKARNDFLKILKSDKDNKLGQYFNNEKDPNPELREKVIFVVTRLCDCEYFIDKYINKEKQEIEEILDFYKNFYFIKKQEDIKKIENHLANKITLTENDFKSYLKDYDRACQLNERKDIIYFLLKENGNSINKNKATQKEMEKYVRKMEDCEKMIKDNKFKIKMRKDDKRLFYKYFKDEKNKDVISKVFNQENIESFNRGMEMEPGELFNEKEICNNDLSENMDNLDKFVKCEKDNSTMETDIKIQNIKTIETHQQSIESIIQTNQGDYVCMGRTDLFVYDKSYEKIYEIKNNDIYTGMQHIEKNGNEDEIELITSTEKEFSLVKIDKRKKNSKNKTYKLYNLTPKSCLPIDDNNHIVFCKEGVYHMKDLFSDKISIKKIKISDDNCINGINISQDLIAITSSKSIPEGNDSIKFYNPKHGKIFKEIEGYSFINSINGLTLLKSEEKNKSGNTILLCACKKIELSEQKNGILLINTDNIENGKEEDNVQFFETGNFEVYSFCPLLTEEKKANKYFLIGGYDNSKQNGDIKLYEININKNDIKFVSNLVFEKVDDNNVFGGFKGAIKCIIESTDRKIFVTCSEGSIYAFPQPEVEFDEKENKETDLFILEILKNSKENSIKA